MERVLRSLNLAQNGRGSRAYVAWLEVRAKNHEGEIDEAAMAAIRRGCYLGKEMFRDRLLKIIEKGTGRGRTVRSRTGAVMRKHGEKKAGRIFREGLKAQGALTGAAALGRLLKCDARKIVLACLLRERTSVWQR